MKIDQIIVLKETRAGEARVALTPTAVSSLAAKQYRVMIESEAGILAGFSDDEYIQAGARIFKLGSACFPSQSLLLRVKRPNEARELLENKLMPSSTVMMGFLDSLDDDLTHIANWQALGISTIPLELLNLTADDPKNAQAAMSRFAGQLALQDALHHYRGSSPKRVTVLGTGPAGMSAALAARSLQLPVQLFGRKERYREAVEAAGITYHVLPLTDQAAFIRAHLSQETIIITAAGSTGERAPLLIDTASLAILSPNAVIVDLSNGQGGNVVGSKKDEMVITNRGISIINVSGYPKAEPKDASEAFAQCMVNLLLEVMAPDGEIFWNNPLLCKLKLPVTG